MWYTAVKDAASTIVLRGGKFKSIFITLIRAVLIAPVIMMRAALCRRCSSELVEATSILHLHITAAYVTLGITTCLQNLKVILEGRPQVPPMNAKKDHRVFNPFREFLLPRFVSIKYCLKMIEIKFEG